MSEHLAQDDLLPELGLPQRMGERNLWGQNVGLTTFLMMKGLIFLRKRG